MTPFLLFLWLALAAPAEVIMGAPEDLADNLLLIPRYDLFDFEDEEAKDRPREYLIRHNQEAKRLNTLIMNAASKNYTYPYELVRMRDVEPKMAAGAKYLLEVVNLKKASREFPQEILYSPAPMRFRLAEEMYRIPGKGQWHIFYVRDLRTGTMYLPGGWKGKTDLAEGMAAVLKALR